MAVIVPTATFADTTVLDPAELNRELYSPAPAEGLYSEPNGGLTTANLEPGFVLTREMIQPGQVVRARAAGSWSTLDNMSDVNLDVVAGATIGSTYAKRQALPGCGIRFYLPFAATAVRINVSFFAYFMKWLGNNDPAAEDPSPGAVQTVMCSLYFDDAEVSSAYRREVAPTFFTTGEAQERIFTAGTTYTTERELQNSESAQAASYDLSFLRQNVAAGFHEAFLGFYVSPLDDEDTSAVLTLVNVVRRYSGEVTLSAAPNSPKPVTAEKVCDIHQRLSFGCRNARVVAFR